MNYEINCLLEYALREGFISTHDIEYAINQVLYLLKQETFQREIISDEIDYFQIMDKILNEASNAGLIKSNSIQEYDHFEAKLIDCFLPRPSELDAKFRLLYKKAPVFATDDFYRFSQKTNYIKTRRNQLNIDYLYQGKYAPLDISINLSKPEKDPLKIALNRHSDETTYPKCALCMENVGFYGNDVISSRSNHRVISLTLNHEKDAWGFQYSPYAYFNEHAIILKKAHIPMQVNETTFMELIDFINQFPHYFIGSNAGLPIVGGSILNHYHFQGGRAAFPIEKARVLAKYKKHHVEVEVLDWPLSVIRVIGQNENKVLDMVNQIFEVWKQYSNPDCSIFAHTDSPHNTVTPIVKLDGANYQFYVVLRNNYTTKERPYGLFHPRDEYFHIKKENIGLIEVMGKAILPGRLKHELDEIKTILSKQNTIDDYPDLEGHRAWIETLQKNDFDVLHLDQYLEDQVGVVFEKVLEDCGVFKTEHRQDFLNFVQKAIY